MRSTINKISSILTPKQRKRYFVLIVLTLFGMILESLGLGLLIPTISLIINPSFIESISSNFGITFFDNYTHKTSLIMIMTFLGVTYILKTLFLTYILDRQNKFAYGFEAYISKTLFFRYLKQPYSFYLETNTSEITKNIMVEVKLLTKYLTSVMNLFNDGLLLTTILFTLLFIEPFGVISIGSLFFLFGLIFFKITNKRINLYGQKRKEYDGLISKLILEGYGGSKEMSLLGRSDFFIKKFNQLNDRKKVINANQTTLSQLPRLYIELLAVIAVVGLVGVMLVQNYPKEEIISKVGVFVVAVFRIIPSYSKISSAFQNIKYNRVVLDLIHEKLLKLKINEPADKVQLKFEKQVEFKSISFKYPKSEKIILKNINIKLFKGETVGFIGPSGSGKSTIVDLFNGLLKPTEGMIYVDGVPMNDCIKSWQKLIGYVPQQVFLTDSSIASNIAFGLPESEIDQLKLEKTIQKADLKTFIDSLPNGLETTVGERGLQISGGQMQRIGIARALYNDPEILILDEMTSALDEETERKVLSSIRELKNEKTILVITHRKNALKDCNKVFRLNGGVLEEFNVKIPSEI